jgi:hypothetical protein
VAAPVDLPFIWVSASIVPASRTVLGVGAGRRPPRWLAENDKLSARTSSRQTWLASSGDARTILWWYVRMNCRSARIGQLSSTALMLSGFAGVVSPGKVAQALELTLDSPRGTAEVRSGLGGTYAALGGWALVSSQPAAEAAVGAAWLGAAGARLASLPLDRPKTSWQFWAYLGAEITFGVTALVSARSRRP